MPFRLAHTLGPAEAGASRRNKPFLAPCRRAGAHENGRETVTTGSYRERAGDLRYPKRQCPGFGGETVSAIDLSIRPRSLLVEMTAVVSFSNAARMTSRLRRKE
jgi:hypothetical protein